MKQPDYSRSFIDFFRDLYPVEGAYGPRPAIPPFLTAWLNTAFPANLGGIPAARNVLDGRTKKEGKSALAGAVALYMASRKPYGEVVVVATDKDQSRDRVLRAIKYGIENGPLSGHAKIYRDTIELDNKSVIQAMPADWQGAAGGNYSCVIFDELHGWVYENQRRLFDELVIPPTQPEGVRWIASYAGWEGESLLLREWWNLALAGEKINAELPIYQNQAASLLAFVDVGESSWRMPWMTDEYIRQIRTSERPNTFKRLWLNEWVSGEGDYLPEGAWAACYDDHLRPVRIDEPLRMVLGIDAATSNDHAGIVGTIWNDETQTVDVKYSREYVPKKGFLRAGKPTIDLTATIGAEVDRLHKAGQIDRIVCDPFQLHVLLVEWMKQGIRVEEFPQGPRRVESDTALLDAVIARQVRHYGDKDLTQHINNAATIESPRGLRIAKRSGAMKIDLAVCLSMSTWAALQNRGYGEVWVCDDPFSDVEYANQEGPFVLNSIGGPASQSVDEAFLRSDLGQRYIRRYLDMTESEERAAKTRQFFLKNAHREMKKNESK
jgi:hypothetical protein